MPAPAHPPSFAEAPRGRLRALARPGKADMRHAEPHPIRVTITRYLDPSGRQCRKGTPGARKVTTRSETWSVLLPRPGRRAEVVSLKTTVESEAWANLARLLEGRQEAADPARAHAKKGLAEHVEDWLAVVASEGCGAKHLGQCRTKVRRVAEAAGWRHLADISRDSLAVALGKLAEAGDLSAETRNRYLKHVRQFARWAHEGGRMPSNPTGKVRALNTEADRRRIRREPTTAEVEALFAALAAPDCPAIAGTEGRARALAYQLAMATGLRAGELASLGPDGFDLDRGRVRVLAGHTKNGRVAEQPLPDWLVAELRAWVAGGGALAWRWLRGGPGASLKRDLARAGVAYRLPGAEPLVFDFHSLRVWYISTLAAQPDMDVRTLMKLARHSTPSLTLKVYARVRAQSERAAVQALPPLPGCELSCGEEAS